jgi:hypothetical protein
MKITESQLDQPIVDELHAFDGIRSSYVEGSSTYVSYDGGKFVSKPMNELNLRRAMSMDDVYGLMDHMHRSENNYVSGYDADIGSKSMAYAIAPLQSTLDGTLLYKSAGRIARIKTTSQYIFLLDGNGMLYRMSRSNVSVREGRNVIELIQTNFVYMGFSIGSITDIEPYKTGALIATAKNGIFYVSLTTDEIEQCVKELDVRKIKMLSDGKTLLVIRSAQSNGIALYNMELGTKLSSFSHLGNSYQSALDAAVGGDEFWILGRSYGFNQSDSLLHRWKLDSSGAEYMNDDSSIAKNNSDNSYKPKFVRLTSSAVLIAGLKGSHLCVWEYARDALYDAPTETVYGLEELSYDDLYDFEYLNGRYYVALKNRVIALGMDLGLIENYRLGGDVDYDMMKITETGIYAISGKDQYVFAIPEKTYQSQIDINIDPGECNNMDVCIRMPSSDSVLFVDADTAQKVSPMFYMKLDGKYHILKLANFSAKRIIMRLLINSREDQITGLVIHKNRIFYK